MENAATDRATPTTVNSSVRTREYLTTAEIERLMAAARKSRRYGHRDAEFVELVYFVIVEHRAASGLERDGSAFASQERRIIGCRRAMRWQPPTRVPSRGHRGAI